MLTNLGGLELAEGNLAAAQKHLQLALQKDPEQPFALINLAAVAIKQGDYKTAHETLMRAQQSPLVEAKAHELLAVLESKETGNANLLRMRLASRTGPPDWAIEKRYIKVLDEVGYRERAISELEVMPRHAMVSRGVMANVERVADQNGTKRRGRTRTRCRPRFRCAPLELRTPHVRSSRAKTRGTSRVMMRGRGS